MSALRLLLLRTLTALPRQLSSAEGAGAEPSGDAPAPTNLDDLALRFAAEQHAYAETCKARAALAPFVASPPAPPEEQR